MCFRYWLADTSLVTDKAVTQRLSSHVILSGNRRDVFRHGVLACCLSDADISLADSLVSSLTNGISETYRYLRLPDRISELLDRQPMPCETETILIVR